MRGNGWLKMTTSWKANFAHALDSSEDRQIRESAYRMIGLMDKVSSQLALKLLAALDQIDSDCRWAFLLIYLRQPSRF